MININTPINLLIVEDNSGDYLLLKDLLEEMSLPVQRIIHAVNMETVPLIIKNIEKLKDFLNGLNTPYEIIIGSNGSTDRTPTLGKELEKKYSNVRFFHIPEKKNKKS